MFRGFLVFCCTLQYTCTVGCSNDVLYSVQYNTVVVDTNTELEFWNTFGTCKAFLANREYLTWYSASIWGAVFYHSSYLQMTLHFSFQNVLHYHKTVHLTGFLFPSHETSITCIRVEDCVCMEYKVKRVEWFKKIKSYMYFYVVPNCCRTPIQKCHVFVLPLSLVAGPLKILTFTLKWAQTNFYLTF